uniref:Uncharacterized protein n=1 Tax=Amphimedon queenslandica TaxID=400682 RepID=A0A1X7VRC3_AMPQE
MNLMEHLSFLSLMDHSKDYPTSMNLLFKVNSSEVRTLTFPLIARVTLPIQPILAVLQLQVSLHFVLSFLPEAIARAIQKQLLSHTESE